MNRGCILWIDDEIDLLKPHVLYLEERGYQVHCATNGRDAIDMVENENFDLILLDQVMPGMDGIETLRRLKEKKRFLPVILITKNEEEWLMDKAISEQVEDYLTKPVNPSQIFMACKKILEEEKILEEKTASDYLQDFHQIQHLFSTDMDIALWWKLYLRLVNWQIQLDKRRNLGLDETLTEQIRTSNKVFTDYMVNHYRDWIHTEASKRPPLSVDVLPQFVLPHLESNEKVLFLVVDCFRLDQVLMILPEIQSSFHVKFDYHLSLLPSATPFCRNALFSGLFLSQIKEQFPDQWNKITQEEQGLNRFEEHFLKNFLKKNKLEIPLLYQKVNTSHEGKAFLNHLSDYQDVSLIALVVNFIDILTHGRSHSEILQEMIPDDAGYRSAVSGWFKNSWLKEILYACGEMSYKIILTSDHGSIKVRRAVQIAGDKQTSTGIRYKYGKNMNCPDKFALVVKRPAEYLLPEIMSGTNYLIAKEDVYFVYPTEYHRYQNLLQNSFQHGGISLEENLVPTLTLSAK